MKVIKILKLYSIFKDSFYMFRRVKVKKELVCFLALMSLWFSCAKEEKMKEKVIKEVYEIEMEKGHLVAKIEGKKFIIDTGSPITSGKVNTTIWGSINFSGGYVLINEINKLTGLSADGLIGMNCLKGSNFAINLKEKKMFVTNARPEEDGKKIPVKFKLLIPELEVNVNGERLSMLFDTGATISYIPKKMTMNLTPVGEFEDFYPGLGRFQTPLYDVDVVIGNNKVTLKAGVLPDMLRGLLGVISDGVLGNEIFQHFSINFDLLNDQKYITIKPFTKGGENE